MLYLIQRFIRATPSRRVLYYLEGGLFYSNNQWAIHYPGYYMAKRPQNETRQATSYSHLYSLAVIMQKKKLSQLTNP